MALQRTTRSLSAPDFVLDESSTVRGRGYQVDWARVGAGYVDSVTAKKTLRPGTVVGILGGKIVPLLTTLTITVTVAGGVATATLANHGLRSGERITVSGATPAEVNGQKTVTVTGANTFTFAATGAANGAATGTITLRAQSAGILETWAGEDRLEFATTGYGVYLGGAFYENLLPEATGTPRTLPAAYKTELLASGGYWRFEPWNAL